MLAHAGQIFGIHGFAAINPPEFFVQTFGFGMGTVCAVADKAMRFLTADTLDGGIHTTAICVKIIGVQHMNFVVIHIFNGNFDGRQPPPEQFRLVVAAVLAALNVGAPTYIDIGNIVDGFPVLSFNQVAYSGAVTSRRTAEETVQGLFFGDGGLETVVF